MSKEQNEPIKVSFKGWVSLFIMCCLFSGLFANIKGPFSFLRILDLNVLAGNFGTIANKVNFMGTGGSGARDGFMFTLSLIPTIILAMGILEIVVKYGGMLACQKLFGPILKVIMGIPGSAGLAFVNSLNGSDVAAVLTRELYDDKLITDDERTIFVAYQYAGSAPIGNMIATQAPLLPIVVIAMGPLILLIILCKFIGANLVRIYLKYSSKRGEN